MKHVHLHLIWLLAVLFLTTACEEEDYYYPSVKLEFVTVEAGADGQMLRLIPDKGEALDVLEDLTHSTITPNTCKRVLSNYEVVSPDEATALAKIYSLQAVTVCEPKKENDPAFQDGLKTDPVEVTSIWVGGEYLNMILTIKVKGGAQHKLGMVEERIDEGGADKVITLSLFHQANGDEGYYHRRAFVSVPLTQYGSAKPIRIKFKYHTYDEDGQKVESDRYCHPGFEYVPNMN